VVITMSGLISAVMAPGYADIIGVIQACGQEAESGFTSSQL
jgi:hypothetical protein